MMRRLADVYHHARGRELKGASTSPEVKSIYDVRCTIVQSTLSQLFKPIKYVANVSY